MPRISPPAMGDPAMGRRANQSLVGHPCPTCRGGFELRADGTNVCKDCGMELVTEYEWNRRQAVQASQASQPETGP